MDVLKRFQEVRVFSENNKPSLHKPVLLLIALSQCYQNKSRLIEFRMLNKIFFDVFNSFALEGNAENSHYPFGKLENDGIWEVSESKNLKRTSVGHLSKKELIDRNILGGFTQEVYVSLISNKRLIIEVALKILSSYIDESLHPKILDFLGFSCDYKNKIEHTNKRNKSMALIGNQKFAISRWWLSKGIEIIPTNPDIFSSRHLRDATKYFIAGSAVVKAINGWLLAAQIIERGRNGLTNFGLSLANNDPKLVKSSSWWSIHLALAFSDRSEPYNQFFLKLDALTKDWISWKELSKRINLTIDEAAEQSIESNLEGVKKMFLGDAPLAELGLVEIRKDPAERETSVRLGSPILSDEIIIHALAMARFSHFRSRESVDFSALVNVGINQFLCCSKDMLRQHLQRMSQMRQWQAYFSFDHAVDLDSITFKESCDPSKTVLLLLQKGPDTWL